jgi:hypothetical protein
LDIYLPSQALAAGQVDTGQDSPLGSGASDMIGNEIIDLPGDFLGVAEDVVTVVDS